MKKIYLSILFLSLFLIRSTNATIHTIAVNDFFFAPASLTVEVFDTVRFVWASGFHTTTSVSVPGGAATWDETISSTSANFDYIVMELGTYNYKCTFHESSGMVASFTAIGTAGITAPKALTNFTVRMLSSSVYSFTCNLSKGSDLTISLYDLTGKKVRKIESGYHPAGEFKKLAVIEDIQKGIYIVEILSDNNRLTKRMIIE